MSEIIYMCPVCGKQTRIEEGTPVPMCCGRTMEPLPYCTSAPNPEMARNYDEDLPCDNGTLAKKKK